jgi:hypothetical protein
MEYRTSVQLGSSLRVIGDSHGAVTVPAGLQPLAREGGGPPLLGHSLTLAAIGDRRSSRRTEPLNDDGLALSQFPG